jgi:D-glycero-D-manno-heptose 1,7-bisphosphate phosphatase
VTPSRQTPSPRPSPPGGGEGANATIQPRRPRAVFLDRDGIVNVDKGYLHKVEEFDFIEDIFDFCRAAEARGFLLIIVTNQAGIGRGHYTEDQFHALTAWMTERLAEQGVRIAKVFFCPYHPTEAKGTYLRDSFDRKPNPGMLLQARDEFELDMQASILVGDKLSDIEAGRRAGVGRLCLIGAGMLPEEMSGLDHVLVCPTLKAATAVLFGE